jgi:DNA polymerase-1
MIIKSQKQFEEVVEKILKEEYIAVDTETEEFSTIKTHAFHLGLDGVGVYSKSVKAYLPYKLLNTPVNRVLFQEVLDSCRLIFHNAKFDLTVFQAHGWIIEKIQYEDTIIMAWLLNENRNSFRLKKLVESVLKVKKDKIVEFRSVKKRPIIEDYGMFTEDYPKDLETWEKQLGMYCIDDCKYTYKLFMKFKPKMEQEGLWRDYSKLELPLIKVIMDMENRGISIDMNYLDKIGEDIEQDIIHLQADIWKEAGKEFDINSPKQLSEVLYIDKKYSLTAEYLTKTGAKSTNIGALNYLKQAYPKDKLLDNLIKYREVFKLHSTYIKGLKERNQGGVIYASFRQIGTQTGRMSSSNPNLQQIPRRDDKYDIRKVFVPRQGYKFVICDLSQIELRVAAYLSKDPIMVKAFQSGKDIHQETADIMGVSRNISKTINFGVLFGTTGYGMSKNLGITVEEADKFISNYFNKFKKLSILIEQAKNTMKKNYAVWTLLKRKRRFPEYAKACKEKDWKAIGRMERQSINSIIQGSAADMIKVMMRNLHEVLPKYNSHLLVSIHDEVLVECPADKAKDVLEVVKHTMENAIKLGDVPVVAEGIIADCWKK